jgi:hypothetical protein
MEIMQKLASERAEWITDFLRYHVLIRVFDGDAGAWLDLLSHQSQVQRREVVFVRWLRLRLTSDPTLLDRIREVVNTSGLWPEASESWTPH